MARVLFSDVTALVRKIADDRDQGGGLVFGDSELYDFGTSVQNEIFDRLVESGLEEAESYTTRTITSADSKLNWDVPVGQVLPDDFEAPREIWEKKQGEPDTAYILMDNKAVLPDEASADTIRYWVWRDDPTATIPGPAITFLAPTSTRTIRLLYTRSAPKITASSTVIYVPNSYNAMAFGILRHAAASRKSFAVADYWHREFEAAYARLFRTHQKLQQRRGAARLPYRFARFYKGGM